MLPDNAPLAVVTSPAADPSRITRHHTTLHGQPVSMLTTIRRRSRKPLTVLLHGLAGNSDSWRPVMTALSRDTDVLAPDLLGHGDSAAPARADYTAGGHACWLRDLLRIFDVDRVHLVGHSFGGGVAMSFAYQFPTQTASLTLISSGGLGLELGTALRAATLPGAVLAAHAISSIAPGWMGQLAHRGARAFGVAPPADLEAIRNALRFIRNADQRRALLQTLRGAVSWSGQRVDATDRLHLLADLPTLLIAGQHDNCIPHDHAVQAHQLLPLSRLELLPAGHFPQISHPGRVSDLITTLIKDTERGIWRTPVTKTADAG